MRILFMGTPEFALPSLKILLNHRLNIVSVVTTRDKPQGRGQKIAASPVKELALSERLPVLEPENLKEPTFLSAVATLQPDLIVVVAFRILPKEVFTLPRLGSFNLHASLLPRYRGAAPINWSIINGEQETGVTTFFLQEKVDTGSIILQARVRIGPNETAGELHDKLAEVGAEIVLQTVRLIELGKAQPRPQEDALASPAPKIFKENCRIDWRPASQRVHDFVRGLSPHPCAWTLHEERLLRVYRTEMPVDANQISTNPMPGTVVDVQRDRMLVATGDGVIALTEIQQEGRKRMGIVEFLRGYPFAVGDRLR